MREISLLLIHCADTPNGKHFTVEDIDEWHKERGFLRTEEAIREFNPSIKHCGYHYVIYTDGSIHEGRSESEVGAHAQGYNSNSLGICLIGKDKFTTSQWNSLRGLIDTLLQEHPGSRIKGHYQVDTKGKTCPNFDVPEYIANSFSPDPDDIYVKG